IPLAKLAHLSEVFRAGPTQLESKIMKPTKLPANNNCTAIGKYVVALFISLADIKYSGKFIHYVLDLQKYTKDSSYNEKLPINGE
ncbi:MAG: hypothetical protein RIT30_1406, partial [Bacteroidota bacterium]